MTDAEHKVLGVTPVVRGRGTRQRIMFVSTCSCGWTSSPRTSEGRALLALCEEHSYYDGGEWIAGWR